MVKENMCDEEITNHGMVVEAISDVNYIDGHMEHYSVKTSALHRKLQSKKDALRIMRQQLELFRTERDQFKLMAETLQLRYSALKRGGANISLLGCGSEGRSLAYMLREQREHNIQLTMEVETLKQKILEMQGDIEVLRTKAGSKERKKCDCSVVCVSHKEETQWKEERTNLIFLLENLKKANMQKAFDIRTLIDEKEEVTTERDAYKCKAHRLNHEMSIALKTNKKHPNFLDIDGILMENKYLYERLQSLENEMELSQQSLSKYKLMLDSKRKKGIMKLGSNSNEESILNHKQVKKLIETGIDIPNKLDTVQDLKCLCFTLLDQLNDKNLALDHQKKTNKILATKLVDLEKRIQLLVAGEGDEISQKGYSPTRTLLNGYTPALVDADDAGTSVVSAHRVSDNLSLPPSEIVPAMKFSPGFAGSEEDGFSSHSTESHRSVLSSEYEGDFVKCNYTEVTQETMVYVDATPSSTSGSGKTGSGKTDSGKTDSGKSDSGKSGSTASRISLVSNSIARERQNNLRELPEHLAKLVEKTLHELDMCEMDNVLNLCGNVDSDKSSIQTYSDGVVIEECGVSWK